MGYEIKMRGIPEVKLGCI